MLDDYARMTRLIDSVTKVQPHLLRLNTKILIKF